MLTKSAIMRLAWSDLLVKPAGGLGKVRRQDTNLSEDQRLDDPFDDPEAARQAVVDLYPVDAAEISAHLDRLARLAALVCDAPVGLVSLVESGQQRFIGRHGTELCETPREDSFCAHAMLEADCMVVPDATGDPRFCDNPLVTGAPFIRFYAGQPLLSREGVPLGSLCVIDSRPRQTLTPRQLEALETLADATMTLLERWRLEQSSDRLHHRSRSEIAELQQRFQVLADAMPQLVWSTTPEGWADYFNRLWCEFTGQPAEASHGQGWMDFLHVDDRQAARDCWTRAVASGSDYEIEYRLRRHDGEYRWLLTRGIPMRDELGKINRWIGTCTDIQEQKADAERLEMLSRELSHRIKNIFAVIGGLISLTIRGKPELASPGAELRERILALGRAHDFVRSRRGRPMLEPGGGLHRFLHNLLAAYQDAEGQRIVISGDDVAIDDRSATPLALFFHELGTNAAKYGALGADGGRIEILIECGDEIVLAWREIGGAQVVATGKPGFGTILVEMSIVRQLGGRLDYDWRPEGLCLTARIPASALLR